jgi:hypothetical protein
VQPNEITEVLNRALSQELLARDVTRFATSPRTAYVDGIPDQHLQATSSYEMPPEQRVNQPPENATMSQDTCQRCPETSHGRSTTYRALDRVDQPRRNRGDLLRR